MALLASLAVTKKYCSGNLLIDPRTEATNKPTYRTVKHYQLPSIPHFQVATNKIYCAERITVLLVPSQVPTLVIV